MNLLIGVVTKPASMTQAAWVFLQAAVVWGSVISVAVFLFWFFGRRKKVGKAALIALLLLTGPASALTTGEVASIQAWAGTQEMTSVPRLYVTFYEVPVTYTGQVVQIDRDLVLVKLENLTKAIAVEYSITNGTPPGQIVQAFKDAFTAAGTDIQRFKAIDDKFTFFHGYLESRNPTPTGTNTYDQWQWYEVAGTSPADANGVTNVPIKEFEAALQ